MVINKLTGFAVVMLVAGTGAACVDESEALGEQQQDILLEELFDAIPNNTPIPNSGGLAASWSTEGNVNLSGHFFTPQGSNGRDCGSCHAPEDGWSLKPSTVQLTFLATGGLHPMFSILDADRPDADLSTVAARWNNFSMLRQGKFTRSINVPANRDYNVIAASDPFGYGTTSRLWFFRRSMPTANYRSHTVSWDGANTTGTVLRDGLIRQARSNITGAQQGAPAADEVVFEIADYQIAMGHAQIWVPGAGALDAEGARGGAEHAANQPLVQGRFDLFDAWANSNNPKRKQIFRGQELFNNVNVASGRRCGACHNAANNGQNVNGTLFDVGASRPQFAKPDMAIYTFQRISDGAIRETTDPGRGLRNGVFADLDKFKTPNLRGLASRAPYFHNGIADDLPAVVKFYEDALGFDFTKKEEEDLAAFMNAL